MTRQPERGGSHEVADRNMVDVREVRVGRSQEMGLAAPEASRHKPTLKREGGIVRHVLYSRFVLGLALVVALAVASGAWWKWD